MKRISLALGIVTAVGVGVAARAAHAKPREYYGTLAAQGVDGKAVYLKSCRECHGVVGAPTKASLRKYDKIPDFTNPKFFEAHPHDELYKAIEKGKGRDMKGFAEKLSPDEMKAVLEYIHTLAKK